MSKTRSLLKYWLPVLIWMSVVFSASADTASYRHSSRIIAPLLHWLFPHLSGNAVDLAVLIARKCAHITEYAILGILFWRALRKPVRHDSRPWSWREAGWSVLFVAFYSSTDEFHQRFVSSRDPSIHDVIIDTTGCILGLLALWAAVSWRKPRELTPTAPAITPGDLPPNGGRG